MVESRSIGVVGALAAVFALGCGSAGSVNANGSTGPEGGTALAGGDGGQGLLSDGGLGPVAPDGGFCSGSGPIVVVGDSEGGAPVSLCTGQIAEATFKSALCTCQDVNLQGYLRTRGFNSSTGAGVGAVDDAGADDGGATGAPVGVNRNYTIPALLVERSRFAAVISGKARPRLIWAERVRYLLGRQRPFYLRCRGGSDGNDRRADASGSGTSRIRRGDAA